MALLTSRDALREYSNNLDFSPQKFPQNRTSPPTRKVEARSCLELNHFSAWAGPDWAEVAVLWGWHSGPPPRRVAPAGLIAEAQS